METGQEERYDPPEEDYEDDDAETENDTGSPVLDYYFEDGETTEEECDRCGNPVWSSFRYCAQCGHLLVYR